MAWSENAIAGIRNKGPDPVRRASKGVARSVLLIVAAAVACAQTPPTATNSIAPSPADREAHFRVDRVAAPGGAEIDTLIGTLPDGGDLPLVSVLIDTLGDSDPTNDTLRNVWVLTYARPSILQRIVAGLPFMYVRPGSPHRRDDAVPTPVLDMSSATGNTWLKLLHALAQAEFLDPFGLPVRATTRAYSGNVADYRNQQVWNAVNALAGADQQNAMGGLSQTEMESVQARLLLSTKLFGDLVSESYLPTAYAKDRDERLQTRQHNWELLRQKAEDNGLYFQPLTLGLSKDSDALLWVEQQDPPSFERPSFNGQLLNISNPFEGDWREKWKGYTEEWAFDRYGSRVAPGTPGSRTARMVPVALYSLDYPKAPLLLVNFRAPSNPRRTEAIRRGSDQLATGILGLTAFGNLEYFAAKSTFTFIRRRHGAALNRSARLRAYAELRHGLMLDDKLDPRLRADLLRRVDKVGINPFQDNAATEERLAREQYAALRAWAASPNGLARKVDQARSREIAHELHSRPARVMLRMASISTFGIYRHTERVTPVLLADIDRQRRFAWHKRFLEQVVQSSPRPEVAYDIEQVQRSLDAVTEIGEESKEFRASSEDLLRRVLAQTSDEITRRRCYECLQKLELALLRSPAVTSAAAADAGGPQ